MDLPQFFPLEENKKEFRYQINIGTRFMAPQVGLEPTTLRLTAECSAIELLRNIFSFSLPLCSRAGKTSVPPAPCGSRQLPTLPSRSQLSTISVWRLNFCVRYGYRWFPFAFVTEIVEYAFSSHRTFTTAYVLSPSRICVSSLLDFFFFLSL